METAVTSIQELCLDGAAILFFISGAAKFFNLRAFREGMIYIPYLPVSATHVVAWTLPEIEVLVAIGLFSNLLVAKVAALLLLALFCTVIFLVLAKRLKVPCGCFEGLGERYMSAATIGENVLLALALVATLPLQDRAQFVQSLPVAGFVLLAYLTTKELWRQRHFLAGLRRQGYL